jgi:hypothetical protein
MTRKPKPTARESKPPTPPRFAVGAPVRVKPGTLDPNFPDIPLGGWAGTIRDVDVRSNPPLYEIEWNQHTLANVHPVYRNRCERDGLELERMWLGEDEIEPDTGAPATIEQPTSIHTRPLNPADQDDRIRAVLGLTSDDPLPEVDDEHLRTYHAYLAEHLSFPFPANFSQETGPFEDRSYPVTVVGLADPDDADDMAGLLCKARHDRDCLELPLGELEVKKGNPNRQLVKDYAYWFWNWG